LKLERFEVGDVCPEHEVDALGLEVVVVGARHAEEVDVLVVEPTDCGRDGLDVGHE
jgi:hypothetical protein